MLLLITNVPLGVSTASIQIVRTLLRNFDGVKESGGGMSWKRGQVLKQRSTRNRSGLKSPLSFYLSICSKFDDHNTYHPWLIIILHRCYSIYYPHLRINRPSRNFASDRFQVTCYSIHLCHRPFVPAKSMQPLRLNRINRVTIDDLKH